MPIHPSASIVLLALAATTPAWAQSSGAAGPARGCPPLETREPNVPEQRPAFEGQTRACTAPSAVAFDLVVLAKGAGPPLRRGSLFVGALKDTRLVRLALVKGRVAGEEHLLSDRGQRVRDVRQGPDGALYVVTDQQNGELWKLAPAR